MMHDLAWQRPYFSPPMTWGELFAIMGVTVACIAVYISGCMIRDYFKSRR